MNAAWLANEHSRIHLIEQWPDGTRKEAALAAARSALESLLQSAGSNRSSFHCMVCGACRGGFSIVAPTRVQHFHSSGLAA